MVQNKLVFLYDLKWSLTCKEKEEKMLKKKGLSLNELLAIIAIISILAGFLLPAIMNASRRCRPPRGCINNLHQIILAIWTYTMDYNKNFPMVAGTAGGAANLDPLYSRYLSTYELGKCPASTSPVPTTSWATSDYAYNTKGGIGLTESDAPDTFVLGDSAIVANTTAFHSYPKPYNVVRHNSSVASIGAGADLTNAQSVLVK